MGFIWMISVPDIPIYPAPCPFPLSTSSWTEVYGKSMPEDEFKAAIAKDGRNKENEGDIRSNHYKSNKGYVY